MEYIEPAGFLCRPNVLDRFAVMNAQLHSISGQMVPLMEHYIVHPKVCSVLWVTNYHMFQSMSCQPHAVRAQLVAGC